jgi:hypothetical protein
MIAETTSHLGNSTSSLTKESHILYPLNHDINMEVQYRQCIWKQDNVRVSLDNNGIEFVYRIVSSDQSKDDHNESEKQVVLTLEYGNITSVAINTSNKNTKCDNKNKFGIMIFTKGAFQEPQIVVEGFNQ